ncbi:recombination protein RecR [Candidatus Peregrinibacteria bacterium]|nr:MAG: recombination protein RecR [Candidatus Peregrinibacteria bacterium]
MSSGLPPSLERLIEALRMLPSVGQKTATRLAFFLLRKPEEVRHRLGNAILEAGISLKKCEICGHFSEETYCDICQDDTREKNRICVVEDSLDLLAIERTGSYRGLYHVLGGALAPLEGIGPGDIRIHELVSRLEHGDVSEIILATNPTLEGEATATLVVRKCESFQGLIMTRLARGIPVGGDVEYADEITLTRALENRLRY